MGTAVVAAIVVQLATGTVVQARKVQEAPPLGKDYVVASEVALGFDPQYALPLLAWFLAGLACLAWPSRKPPQVVS